MMQREFAALTKVHRSCGAVGLRLRGLGSSPAGNTMSLFDPVKIPDRICMKLHQKRLKVRLLIRPHTLRRAYLGTHTLTYLGAVYYCLYLALPVWLE